MLVHAHRHNNSSLLNLSTSSKDSEDQSFSEMDFSIIRDVMYKYSQKAQWRFFQIPELCYLFVFFSTNRISILRTKHRLAPKGPEYGKRIMKDIEEMNNEAMLSLQQMSTTYNNEKA